MRLQQSSIEFEHVEDYDDVIPWTGIYEVESSISLYDTEN